MICNQSGLHGVTTLTFHSTVISGLTVFTPLSSRGFQSRHSSGTESRIENSTWKFRRQRDKKTATNDITALSFRKVHVNSDGKEYNQYTRNNR